MDARRTNESYASCSDNTPKSHYPIFRVWVAVVGSPLVFVISMGVVYAATESFAASGSVGAVATLGYVICACVYLTPVALNNNKGDSEESTAGEEGSGGPIYIDDSAAILRRERTRILDWERTYSEVEKCRRNEGFYVTMLDRGGRYVDVPVEHCKESAAGGGGGPIYGDSAAILRGRTDSEIEKYSRRAEGIYETMLDEGRRSDTPVERGKGASSPEIWC